MYFTTNCSPAGPGAALMILIKQLAADPGTVLSQQTDFLAISAGRAETLTGQ